MPVVDEGGRQGRGGVATSHTTFSSVLVPLHPPPPYFLPTHSQAHLVSCARWIVRGPLYSPSSFDIDGLQFRAGNEEGRRKAKHKKKNNNKKKKAKANKQTSNNNR